MPRGGVHNLAVSRRGLVRLRCFNGIRFYLVYYSGFRGKAVHRNLWSGIVMIGYGGRTLYSVWYMAMPAELYVTHKVNVSATSIPVACAIRQPATLHAYRACLQPVLTVTGHGRRGHVRRSAIPLLGR